MIRRVRGSCYTARRPKGIRRMAKPPSWPFLAALALLAGGPARAEFMDWSYRWDMKPGAVVRRGGPPDPLQRPPAPARATGQARLLREPVAERPEGTRPGQSHDGFLAAQRLGAGDPARAGALRPGPRGRGCLPAGRGVGGEAP